MAARAKLQDSGNHLLNALPRSEFSLFEPQLKRISWTLKQVIQYDDAVVNYIYFPTTALASLLTVLADEDPVETGTVGSDGFVGIATALGIDQSPHRVICQMGGEALRLPVDVFLSALKPGSELLRLVHRYLGFSLRSHCQGIACNATHMIEERACRWLLMLHDQAGVDEFPMTHEFLAFMLGVRRQGVTMVARTLQNAGLIQYRRGSIAILQRDGLEDAACECYGVIRNYYDRFVL